MVRASLPATFAEALRAFHDYNVVADSLGLPYQTVSSWARRNYIPPAYYVRLARLATENGLRGISQAALHRMEADHDQRRVDVATARRHNLLAEQIARRR
jgi:hypothetical protein